MTTRRTGHFRSRIGRLRKQAEEDIAAVVEPSIFPLTLDFTDWGVLPTGTLQYSEDFSSIGSNWDTSNQGGLTTGNDGDVSFFNETTLRLPQASSGRIVLKNSVFSQEDMVATLRWHRIASAGSAGRRTGLLLGVRCQDNSDGYWLSHDGTANEIIQLIKRVSGVNTVLQGGTQVDSADIPGNVMLSLVAIAKGDHIAFLVFTDGDFTDLLTAIDVYDSAITGSGSVGIGGFNNATHDEFADDIAIYDYQQVSSSQYWERSNESFGIWPSLASRYGSVFSDDVIMMQRFTNSRDWTKSGSINLTNARGTLRVSENITRLQAQIGLRLDANGDGYWGGTDLNVSVGVRVLKRVSGVFTELGETQNLGFPTINTEYKVEFSADGTTLRARLLDSSGNVVNLGSGNYDKSVTDSTFTGAGGVGVGRSDNNASGIAPTSRTCMKDLLIEEL